ncbi:MAG: hypothetical protein GY832_27280 [Chloroflexi bacterium]|nr:hypothetical protein [Chloroflexota bacterium]
MSRKSKTFNILALIVIMSMIATTVSARVDPSPAQGIAAETVDPSVVNDGVAAPMDAPQPPQPEGQDTGPYVSDPVAPADTRGLPRAATVNPYTGMPRETLGIAAGGTAGGVQVSDPVVQRAMGVTAMPPTIVNFEGINNLDGVAPPDTDGQVGPNHYVQMVNLSTAVYSKTGDLLYGPFHPNDLWPFGDPCRSFNDGDPVVLYDQLVDRWLLTQFAVSLNGPYYQCIAVSKGPEPTDDPDDWYPYTFLVSEDDMNDYPKLGVWPDAYYMSANQFNGTGGAGVWAFDRDAMLVGDPATFQYFEDASWNAFLPSNLMGDTLPPAGAPNHFVRAVHNDVGDDVLEIYAFHTDWLTPTNTTFNLVKVLPVAKFDPDVCFATRDCIPQPDTANGVDTISGRLMMHLWYRNFGTHEALVVNQTVDVDDGHAGIRWYEIRDPGPNAVLAQQSTFAPDEHHRWMGSIAMDKVGNIALGYSISSDTIYPSIRYTGREAGDPLGYMSLEEGNIISGTGSTTNPNRWGDYSAMSVDPVDDCTFWYTQEYIETTGEWNWQTRIASFRFPSCLEDKGQIEGTVSATGGGAIGGAKLVADSNPTYVAYSHADGSYGISNMVSGNYTVTAEAYGYAPATVTDVPVADNATTEVTFTLGAYSTYVVTGTVTDATTGWPLYAKIEIEGFMYNEAIWTDPATGEYAVTLAGDPSAYTFEVSAWVIGYESEIRSVGPLTADVGEDFALNADEGACSAPGYAAASTVYAEDFESSGVYTPTGEWEWGVPTIWPYGCGSGTQCWGTDLDGNHGDNVEETLTSPVIDLSAYPTGTILTANWSQAWSMEETFDYVYAEVSIDGGPWETMWMASTFGEWTDMGYGISDAAEGTAQLRWRLISDGGVNFEGYYVDNVSITEGCAPTSGGLVVGNVYDEATSTPQVGAIVENDTGESFTTAATPDDPAVDDGFYALFSLAGTRAFTATGNYGYAVTTEDVVVATGETAAQDFYLPDSEYFVLEGVVTDSATDWPLYANITVNGYPGAPLWNDPVTGYYSVTVAEGGPYNLIATTWVDGYDTANVILTSVTGDTTLDIPMDADLAMCNAPGYEATGLMDGGFELGSPNPYWNEDDMYGYGVLSQQLPHSGAWGTWLGGWASDENWALVNQDLVIPNDVTTLGFWLAIGIAAPLTDTGYFTVTMDNTVIFTADHTSSAFVGAWGQATVDVSAYADGGVHTLQLYEWNPAGNPGNINFFMDDVTLNGTSCVAPTGGGLVVGNVSDANTGDALNGAVVENQDGDSVTAGATADAAVDEAFYTIFSTAGPTETFTAMLSGGGYGVDRHPVTVVADTTTGLEDFELPAGVLGAAPTSMSVSLTPHMSTTLPLTLVNTGILAIDFSLVEWQPGANPTTVQYTSFRLVKYAKLETMLPAAQVVDPMIAQHEAPVSPGHSPMAAGDILAAWGSGMTAAWGTAYDRLNDTVWVGSPCAGWGGDCRVVEFQTDGTPTGRWYGYPWGPNFGPADMAYNPNTGMIWMLDVATDNCVHELDPDFGWTGDTICGFTTTSMRGLAYNPDTDVFYTGRWDYGGCANGTVCQAIHEFKGETWDFPGEVITTTPLLGVDISGLTFNPDAELMFIAETGADTVREYDLTWTEVSSFTVAGLGGNGADINCDGNLWLADDPNMLLVDSGVPAALCPDLPWLSEDPITGTVLPGGDTAVDVTFDAGTMLPGLYNGMLRVSNNSPYGPIQIPMSLAIIHQPTWDKEVYVNGEMVDEFPATVVPSDTVEIVDTVSITPDGDITFSLTEEWSESLELVDYGVYAMPGGTLIVPEHGTVLFPSSGSMVVEVDDSPSTWTYVITKTFNVLDAGDGTDTITETLWMENTYPQLDPVVLQFVQEGMSMIYLPLVVRQ